MLIRWSLAADNDLAEILAYFISIAEEENGRSVVSQLIKSAGRLARYPLSGRLGRLQGTREIILRKLPYILVYRILSSEFVEIARVLHTSRLWPNIFDEDAETLELRL